MYTIGGTYYLLHELRNKITMAEINGKKLFLNGYIYLRSRSRNGRVYWDCQKVRQKECKGRVVTNDPQEGEPVIVHKGPAESPHQHAPNQEEVRAAALTQNLKRKAAANPGQPPAQILHTELSQVGPDVLSQLPEREALAKAMRRERRQNLPTNPRSLLELNELPERFQYTLLNEKFLIYDSRRNEEEEVESEEELEENEEEDDCGWVLVFSSCNIELLCNSPTWFFDGTFKTSPTLFTQ